MSAAHRTRVVAAGLVLVLAAACGGERQADAGAADTAALGSAPVSPTDTVAAVTPDTVSQATAEKGTGTTDTAAGRHGAGDRQAQAATPAPKPAPSPVPRPAPQPRDTQAQAPAPAPSTQPAAAPMPAQDTGSAQAAAGQQPAQAPAEQQAAQTAPMRDEYHQAPRDTVVQAVYDGWKQYNLNCARCHGEDVLGSTIAPHLIVSVKPDGPINTKESFIQVVCAGRPEKGMPAWCPLGMEMEKIEQIYSYVKGRSAGEIGPGRPALREGS